MKNLTQLSDCLTMVAAVFGRVASTGLPKRGEKDYRFAFAADGAANYTCAIDYIDGDITIYIFMDWLFLDAIDANQKTAALYQKIINKAYNLGGQLCAAGYSVEYK